MKDAGIFEKVKNIEREIRELCDKRYRDGVSDGFDDGYNQGYFDAKGTNDDEIREQGRKDAWECARKMMLSDEDGGIALSDILKIFGMTQYSAIKRFSASEAIAKLKEYEKKQKKDYCEGCRYWDEESKRGCKSPCIEKIEYEEKRCHEHKYALVIGKFTQALNEFADRLEQIEKKYADKSES